ncbi:hypothetical protein PVOR_15284 [Paenibacillus vortex V453]|uniref:Uncharacterized protein n=1 Tax=Paenibacillus vortex V453 TaxID=715225 RepID=A0A2R9SUG9_9BACL|nr:hypothetical protein PVOR_15284 [Paenibacillus vortex V453]
MVFEEVDQVDTPARLSPVGPGHFVTLSHSAS